MTTRKALAVNGRLGVAQTDYSKRPLLTLVTKSPVRGKILASAFIEMLRESLIIEQGSLAMIKDTMPHASRPDIRRRLTLIQNKINQDSKALSQLIRDLGGNPLERPAQNGELQQQRVDALLQLEIPPGIFLISGIENLMLVTTQAWTHSTMIGESVPFLWPQSLRLLASRVIEEFEEDKIELMSACRQTLTSLRIGLAISK